jgi:hypothetical protein
LSASTFLASSSAPSHSEGSSALSSSTRLSDRGRGVGVLYGDRYAEMTGLLGPLSLLLWAILFAHDMGVNMVRPSHLTVIYITSGLNYQWKVCIN